MNYEIKLTETGVFEVPAIAPAGDSYKIGCDSDVPGFPWFVLGLDEAGVKWKRLRQFSDLDGALKFAFDQVAGHFDLVEYDVRMPCGSRFRRPGKVPAEQVLFSMGWVYIEEMLGYTVFSIAAGESQKEALEFILGSAEGTNVNIGSVDFVEEENGRSFWCADVSLPFRSFVRKDEIETQWKLAFGAEHFYVIDGNMSYRARAPIVSHTGVVLDFQKAKAARKKAA